MPKRTIKRWLPSPEKIRSLNALGFLGEILHEPNLFHLNRQSVSMAIAVGIFVAFLPIPGQMPVAALLALLLRCNLPISVILVWISNPVTIPAIFYATYKFGAWLLGTPPINFTIELSWEWISTELQKIWAPLLLGSILCGLVLATTAYFGMRAFWRWHVLKRWKHRLAQRRLKEA
ncbi:DUF2062 domain-containing protein [Biformimicrobium ophioploci]|uniref:DUF2062 domain-containing protein n=1 Tax=Biformimicrobium ophioploci TaxID=3036711 RepID=A0ABQ6M1I8_9GAMM|nr:DUF2062 domain-containing protein [Microbulbifer sp. NKW57]GMG88187.1 DUF2062 domain-containing protein [Microbulbifer sp. NKW57]